MASITLQKKGDGILLAKSTRVESKTGSRAKYYRPVPINKREGADYAAVPLAVALALTDNRPLAAYLSVGVDTLPENTHARVKLFAKYLAEDDALASGESASTVAEQAKAYLVKLRARDENAYHELVSSLGK